MSKKAQNWSIEMIVTSALFITFFVTFVTLSFVGNSSDLRETEYASDELAGKLLAEGTPASIVESRNALNHSKLVELSGLSYDELQDLFGVSEDFCIMLKDSNGFVIPINGKYGIGSDDIKISGNNCTSIAT